VVYRGGLRPDVVFVGEAPGADEDRVGVPFVGRSGARLDAAIREIGLADGTFGVLNVLKCRPPGNRFDRRAARTCRPFLDRQLAMLAPRVVVTLGAHALRAIDPGAPPVLQAAGQVRTGTAPPVFPLIHPAAAMRSRRWGERWTHDVREFRRWWTSRGTQTS
jgi:uracil-DNA glycosylase